MRYVPAVVFALVLPLSAAPLTGVRTVGPDAADYPSLTAAIADIQSQSVGGALLLELQTGYLSTVETFPLVVPTFNGASADNTVTIRPANGATALSITSGDITAATVDLNGARFVRFDGRAGGAGTTKQLTIANTSSSGPAVRFINDANRNILRHITLQSVNTSVSSGTVVFSTTTGPNGNDDNTIDTCDLRDGATTPKNGIYSSGSTTGTAQSNSGITITNCNLFNFYASAGDAAGVRIASGNTDWTISGNSFYQTVTRATVSAGFRAIYINNTFGNNFTISGNFIGGSAPNAGGTAWTTTGTTAYLFQGIRLNLGIVTPSSIRGNTIANMVWTSSSPTSTLPGVWSGIFLEAGRADIGDNVIGEGTGTGSIAVTTSGSGGTTFGIGSTSRGTVAIDGNVIGSITTSHTTTGAASLVGIQVTDGPNTISDNLVGSSTTANSLNASTSNSTITASPQQVTGITAISSSSSASITGNTVANLNNNHNSTAAGQIRGIVTATGVNTIDGNTVRNLSTTSQNLGTTASASVLGISQTSASSPQSVSQNVVHSLSNSAISGKVTVTGILYYGPATGMNPIARNQVHSLEIASTSLASGMIGIQILGGTFTAQNNMVRVGLNAAGVGTAGAASVFGIQDISSTAGRNFYHNSVYLGGSQTSGVNNTWAIRSGDAANACTFRNNIFINARSNSSGGGKHYAVAYGGTTANSAGLTANGNILLASGSGGILGLFNNADRTTLAEWQAATGQDVSSAVADPLFVNPTGDATAVDLHLQASSPAEGGGLSITSVTDDFDGQTRDSLTPVDIGADAGNQTSTGDLYAPSISYPPLSGGSTANRTLTGWVSIEDNSGSVASGTTAPRFYYKKATDADVFGGNTAADDGWKYVTATGGNSPYSFTVDYSLINGGSVNVGDNIQYFVVAQDTANNLASSPAAATISATPPVPNINGKPGAGLNSYAIVTPLSGAVTVGPTGTYPSLSGAGGLFAALNSSALVGNLTVRLTGDTAEDGGIALNATMQDNYPSALTLTLQPDSATMRTISGSGADGLIRLSGAKHVTVDGRFGGSGRFLTFRNTNTNGPTIALIDDASNNTVRNCVVEGAAGGSMEGGLSPDNPCVVLFGKGVVTGNDNNLVTGNQIRDRSDAAGVPGYLVYSNGTSDTVANSNNTISNNELFNFMNYGVVALSGSESCNITGNEIYQTAARTTILAGIALYALGTTTICDNTVRDLTTGNSASGISIVSKTGTSTVAGNRIWKIGNTAGSSGSATGIFVQSSGVGESITLANNMVTLGSSSVTSQKLCGIYDNASIGSTVVTVHNSVLINGTGWGDSWAYNNQGNSTATVKNNVFLNLRTGTSNHFAANRDPASAGSLSMNFNVYAGTGETIAEDFFDGSNGSGSSGIPISHAQWQVNVPGDTYSSASNPGGNYTPAMFVDPANGDLHLVPGGNPLVNKAGTHFAGVTTDYDGDARLSATPDIGADELPTLFQLWAQANGVGSDPQSPGANSLANLLNFAFGMDPNIAARNTLSHTGSVITPGGISSELLSGTPAVKFIRRADHVAAGLTYTARFSADLDSWVTNLTTPSVLANDGVNQIVSLNYPLLPGGVQARFFKLEVSLP